MDLWVLVLFGIVVVTASIGAAVGVSMGLPESRKWVRRLGKDAAEASARSAEELEALRRRVAELEERLDFAERMLTRADAPERLPGRAER